MEPVSYLFILTTLLTVFLFYKAARRSNVILIFIFSWMIVQAFVCLSGFYKVTTRFPLLIGPPLLLIIMLFSTRKGRVFIDSLDLKTLTILHVIRIPVELVLWQLFLEKTIPQVMTFEGHNWDIISGITAPLIYFANKKLLLIWNFVCLGLLLNIVVIAILSAPTPFQQLAFDQPNIAVFQFPYIWLPSVIVPVVLFSHLAAIRRLIILKN